MKERQRWRPEEDAVLCAYVQRYGPREWHLVSQRMNVALGRDAKSCLERWKNYLRPGIKQGALTADEQRLLIRLQAEHGNKWKRIAAELPGRTPKRLGKWWEVFKDKQVRDQAAAGHRPSSSPSSPVDGSSSRYEWLLESFAEKLVRAGTGGHDADPLLMAAPPPATLPPPWLSNSNAAQRPPSPSVMLTLSSGAAAATPWLQAETVAPVVGGQAMSELAECWREMEEGQRAWAAHRKEAAWRMKRVELQLEAEKAAKRREKAEEFEAKLRALWQEQQVAMERIEAEHWEQVAALRRDAEAKEEMVTKQWAMKHARFSKCVEQMGFGLGWPTATHGEMNGR